MTVDKAYYNVAMSPKDIEAISLYQQTKSIMSAIHQALLMGSYSKNDLLVFTQNVQGNDVRVEKKGYSLLIPYLSRDNFTREVHDELKRVFKKAGWAGVMFIHSNVMNFKGEMNVTIDDEMMVYSTHTYPPIGFLLVVLVKP